MLSKNQELSHAYRVSCETETGATATSWLWADAILLHNIVATFAFHKWNMCIILIDVSKQQTERREEWEVVGVR